VEGETFQNNKYNNSGKSVALSNFYIDKYEVTQKEWVEVMGSNSSVFVVDNMPVENRITT
jgi:formylglycine-generating enzyme required for sulfatase activity